VIALMLMGGGVLTAGALMSGRPRVSCEDARAQTLADADAICQRASSTSGSGSGRSSWFFWSSTGYSASNYSGSNAAVANTPGSASKVASNSSSSSGGSVSRGGFGGAGASAASSGS